MCWSNRTQCSCRLSKLDNRIRIGNVKIMLVDYEVSNYAARTLTVAKEALCDYSLFMAMYKCWRLWFFVTYHFHKLFILRTISRQDPSLFCKIWWELIKLILPEEDFCGQTFLFYRNYLAGIMNYYNWIYIYQNKNNFFLQTPILITIYFYWSTLIDRSKHTSNFSQVDFLCVYILAHT